jgi:glycosyltransferase EpsD
MNTGFIVNKKMLVTSTELMNLQFIFPHIEMLLKMGYEIDLACSEVGGRFNELVEKANEKGIRNIYKLTLTRTPYNLINFKGYKEVRKVVGNGKYDVIWTNEPVVGAITRLAAHKARKNSTKVFYMAHGFHFFKGAPLINWMLYYPAERFLARYTDVLITINKEDYARAKKFKAKSVKYIPGVGVDIENFLSDLYDRSTKRKELGIDDNDIVLLSGGSFLSEKITKQLLRRLLK